MRVYWLRDNGYDPYVMVYDDDYQKKMTGGTFKNYPVPKSSTIRYSYTNPITPTREEDPSKWLALSLNRFTIQKHG